MIDYLKNAIAKILCNTYDKMNNLYLDISYNNKKICTDLEILTEYSKYSDNITSARFLSNHKSNFSLENNFIGVGFHNEAGPVIIFVGDNDIYLMCSPKYEIKNEIVCDPFLCLWGLYFIYYGDNYILGFKEIYEASDEEKNILLLKLQNHKYINKNNFGINMFMANEKNELHTKETFYQEYNDKYIDNIHMIKTQLLDIFQPDLDEELREILNNICNRQKIEINPDETIIL